MSLSFEHDRGAQWLLAADGTLDVDTAAARLDGAALVLSYESAEAAWVQAALMSAVAAGRRMFRRGVFLQPADDAACRLILHGAGSIRRRLVSAGAQDRPAPAGAARLHIGPNPPDGALACWADGWSAYVGPRAESAPLAAGNEISGTLAAALGLQEVFRRHVLRDLRAGRRRQGLSAWGSDAPADATLRRLPRDLWILGLGNLGQAALAVLGMSPYWDPGDVRLLIQDFDVAGEENLGVQVLTEPHWIGRRKARCVADWADRLGFRTDISERAFAPGHAPSREEPRVLLGCVDNLAARRAAANAGFDLVIDAGLGATAPEAFDVRLHGFPGRKAAEAAWPEVAAASPTLSPGLERAVAEGRLDTCGALTIAGRSIGAPCTALAAAALQVGQVVRALETGRCCDLVDVSLPLASEAVFGTMPADLARPPAFTGGRSA